MITKQTLIRSRQGSNYTTYIARCADGTLYTGFALNVTRRIQEHNTSTTGAKYTRSRGPVVLVYSKQYRTRSRAQQEEARVKRLSREEKLILIKSAGFKESSIRGTD